MNESLKSIQLDGHGNVVLQHVSAQGDIIINTLNWDTFVQRYTYEQQARIQELQKLLSRSEELFDVKTLHLSQQINELQTEVARREAQVKHMIEEYADKDLSQTDARYREAFELFLAGKLDEALALLDDAQLEAELRKAQAAQRRVAESYRLKADILQLQYDFAAAEDYLHRAYAAYPSWGNCLTLANFYKNLNHFPSAEQHYQQCLELADDDSELASTLNNLGLLQRAKNEFPAAEQSYRRALDIREQLARVNPQTYLPYVATTLNNLAILQKDKNEFPAAEQSYRRALDIRRAFAEAMPQTYDLPVCETSLNLVMFYFGKFQNGTGTEEDAQQFVALLTDVEIRLQRFPPDIPLVQRMWGVVHDYKQFLDGAGAA
jgi:tetratricopeptide (TPR) repeat protein